MSGELPTPNRKQIRLRACPSPYATPASQNDIIISHTPEKVCRQALGPQPRREGQERQTLPISQTQSACPGHPCV